MYMCIKVISGQRLFLSKSEIAGIFHQYNSLKLLKTTNICYIYFVKCFSLHLKSVGMTQLREWR